MGLPPDPLESSDDPLVVIGERVRRWRRKKELTQTALGQAAGVGQGSVSAYEAGTREMSILVTLRVARALGLDICTLLQTDP